MTLSVADGGYKVLLLQCVPGQERNTVNHLQHHFDALRCTGIIGEFAIWKVFGPYDLLCIYEVKDFGPDLLYSGSIPGIEKSNEILAFSWSTGGRDPACSFTLSAVTSAPVLGLSLKKVHPRVMRRGPLDIEQSFIAAAMERSWGEVLSTLGWSEYALFLTGDSVYDVFHRGHELTVEIAIQLKRKTPVEPFFMKSYTLIAIPFQIIESARDLDRLFKHPFGKARSKRHEPAVQLALRCRPAGVPALSNQCMQLFKIEFADVVFGQDDLFLDLSQSGLQYWSDFIEALLDLRATSDTGILETSTQIQAKPFDGKRSRTRLPPRTPMPVFHVSEPDIAAFRQLGEPLAQSVLNILYSFNTLMSQELVRDCFYDLFRFPYSLLLASRSANVDGLEKDLLERKLERFAFAADQRSMGTFAGLEIPEGRFSPFKGGIQRVLLGLSKLPLFLVEETCGHFWPGFSVIGFDRRFWHSGEIVNLPVDACFRPERWWGIAHEAAHALLHLDKNWLPVGAIEKVLRARLGEQNAAASLVDIEEIFLDWFGFVYFFCEDYDLHLESIWTYLISLLPREEIIGLRLHAYLLRSFVIFLIRTDPCALQLERMTRGQLERKYRTFERHLRRLSGVNDIGDVALSNGRDRALEAISMLRSIFPLLGQRVRRFDKAFRRNRSRRHQQLSEQTLKGILNGQVGSPEVDPFALILGLHRLSLRKPEKVTFRARIATILTLWGSYISGLKREDESAFAP